MSHYSDLQPGMFNYVRYVIEITGLLCFLFFSMVYKHV